MIIQECIMYIVLDLLRTLEESSVQYEQKRQKNDGFKYASVPLYQSDV